MCFLKDLILMTNIFNVNFEFDRNKVNQKIEGFINEELKGYICVVEGNVLTNANKYKDYNNIINSSILNICDGSSIAFMGNLIYKEKFSTYVGSEVFDHFTSKEYNQYFLGNTDKVLTKLEQELKKNQSYNNKTMSFRSLPFKHVDDFDYISIAKEINFVSPEIIWVSLGAPKQEVFMSKLLPYLDKGILFGIGAVFNFYIEEGNNTRIRKLFRILKLEWIYRITKEPKKTAKRVCSYLKLLPNLVIDEMKIKHIKRMQ